MKKWWLYILRLEDGNYYVGITTQYPQRRFDQHVTGFMGARWTRAHKPVEFELIELLGKISKEEAETIENKKTRELISQYGLNKVRGGDLTNIEPYITRFGRIFTVEDWKTLTVVIFMMLAIAGLLLDKYNLI